MNTDTNLRIYVRVTDLEVDGICRYPVQTGELHQQNRKGDTQSAPTVQGVRRVRRWLPTQSRAVCDVHTSVVRVR